MMEDVSLHSDKAFSYYKNKGKNNIYSITWLLKYLFLWPLAPLALKTEHFLHEIPARL